MNYRERWYHERGLPYEPPNLSACPPFRCVGGAAPIIKPRERKLPPPARSFHEPREPGEDSAEDIGEAA